MKKISLLLATCLMLCAFSSCTPKIQYSSISSDWNIYGSVQELVEATDLALIGTVTNVFFQVADKRTGLPPAEGAKEKYDQQFGRDVMPEDVFELITLYDINVTTVYKGEAVESTRIKMRGGLKDQRMDEQLALMREYGLQYYPVYEEEIPELKVGETYLLLLGEFENSPPTTINIDQAIFNLHNPFEKIWKDLTAKDIISYFGADKWDTFWTQWQQDNPDWETWIDPETMETTPTET